MIELKGEHCPLLFDKWRPEQFTEISGGDSGDLRQFYHFPFAWVTITSGDVYFPMHFINATQMPKHYPYPIDVLFEPQILEMFHDAKTYMEAVLKTAARIHPELAVVDIDKQSFFGRNTVFLLSMDYANKPDLFRDVSARTAFTNEVYTSLLEMLAHEFTAIEVHDEQGYVLGFPLGECRRAKLPCNVEICTDVHSNSEINSGNLHMTVTSNERATPQNHGQVLESIMRHIRENFADRLHKYNGLHVCFSQKGNGTDWIIDLSKVRPAKKLEGRLARQQIPA